jgi:hypothetical protein
MKKNRLICLALSALALTSLGGCEALYMGVMAVETIPFHVTYIRDLKPLQKEVTVRGKATDAGDDWFMLRDDSGEIKVLAGRSIKGTRFEKWLLNKDYQGKVRYTSCVEVVGNVNETGNEITALYVRCHVSREGFYMDNLRPAEKTH